MKQATKKEDLDRLLSVNEVCEYLQISRPTFYRLHEDGKLHAVRVGRSLRVTTEQLKQFLARNVSKQAQDS